MTLEDFLTHVLALKCAITPDLIEAELKRSPLLASPALASVRCDPRSVQPLPTRGGFIILSG